MVIKGSIHGAAKYRKPQLSADGSFIVRPGDWLSMYSLAMDGTLNHIKEFGRKNKRGQLVPISNPNLIFAGERLYHLPSCGRPVNGEPRTPGAALPKHEVGPQEKKSAVLEDLAKNRALTPEEKDLAEKVYTGLETAGRLAEFFEVFDIADEALGPVGAIIAVAGIPVQFMAIDAKFHTNEHLTAMHAAAYARTAWAFNQPVPPPSPQLMRNIRSGGGEGRVEFSHSEAIWRNVAQQQFRELDRFAGGTQRKESVQVALRRLGNDSPAELCRTIMKKMGETLSDKNAKRAWEVSPIYPQ